ncbi:MAG: sigma-54 dependent transcriptional regulator [Fibromonadaceae bacterium]|jgi:DNA-binding NtrC family response regulator|nr:sigma-54 dependent transcriptional regulator [Fibromonadaceae bacterium]
MAKILVVDDEEIMRDAVADILELKGHRCTVAANPKIALEQISIENPDLIISDYKMPGMTGIDLLKAVKKERPSQPFLMMTAFGSIEMAVEALQNGADHFIEKKDLEHAEIIEHAVAMVLEKYKYRTENSALRKKLCEKNFIGHGEKFLALNKFVETVAPTNASVLITGESGVGKEVLARAVHYQSLRAGGPFVKINCAALPESLIESELFGHEKGAFTGALKTRRGKFELADGGTLLLDEIGEMPLAAQSKLLRVLQERVIVRIGGDDEIKVDVRIICTTNRDLKQEVENGTFREDLFYRLSVVPVHIPPLRERKEDIPDLLNYFIGKLNEENGYAVEEASEETVAMLQKQPWPGNIRQLENAIERAMVFCKSGILKPDFFDIEPAANTANAAKPKKK